MPGNRHFKIEWINQGAVTAFGGWQFSTALPLPHRSFGHAKTEMTGEMLDSLFVCEFADHASFLKLYRSAVLFVISIR